MDKNIRAGIRAILSAPEYLDNLDRETINRLFEILRKFKKPQYFCYSYFDHGVATRSDAFDDPNEAYKDLIRRIVVDFSLDENPSLIEGFFHLKSRWAEFDGQSYVDCDTPEDFDQEDCMYSFFEGITRNSKKSIINFISWSILKANEDLSVLDEMKEFSENLEDWKDLNY